MRLPKKVILIPVCAILLLGCAIASAAVINHERLLNTQDVSTQITPTSEVQNQDKPNTPISTPSISLPQPTSTPTPTPTSSTPTQDPAVCSTIALQEKSDLALLNTQIQQQLEKMKEIMASSSLSNSLGTDGGILSQSQTTQSFNAANDEATQLQTQYGDDQVNYQTQLFNNKCYLTLKAQLNG